MIVSSAGSSNTGNEPISACIVRQPASGDISPRILRWGPLGAVFWGASAEWMEKGRGSGRYQALGVTAVLQ